MDQNVGSNPVNIYVLNKMPRDCTAPPFWDAQMNSPDAICRIQYNMAGQSKLKKKNNRNGNGNGKPSNPPKKMVLQGNPLTMQRAAAAYSAVVGRGQGRYPVLNASNGRCVVQNFEQVSGIGASGSFTANVFQVNPSNSTTFPWLTSIAQNYQKFRFLSLRFIWTPICSTTTTGSVYVYIAYDYLDNTPTSLAQVTASDTSCSGNAWFGAAINQASAFSKDMSTATNIFVDYDPSRVGSPWYYCRDASTAPTSGITLTGTATGGNGTLAVTQGTIIDPLSIPCRLITGVDTTNPTSGTLGYVYAAYIVEFADPIAASLNV